MSLVKLSGIKKTYLLGKTEVPALKGVDLEIERGEFTVVMGPSGSGKTTLLNIIGCLDRASSGSFLLDGQEIGERRAGPCQRPLGGACLDDEAAALLDKIAEHFH